MYVFQTSCHVYYFWRIKINLRGMDICKTQYSHLGIEYGSPLFVVLNFFIKVNKIKFLIKVLLRP